MSATKKTKGFRTWVGNFLNPNPMHAKKSGAFGYTPRLDKGLSRKNWTQKAFKKPPPPPPNTGRQFTYSGGRRSTHRKKRNRKTKYRK